MAACAHGLCAAIGGGACSVAALRSRGCTPGQLAATTDPAILDEVERIVPAAAAGDRAAAIRLAQIVRREALDGRNLLGQVRAEELACADALARLIG